MGIEYRSADLDDREGLLCRGLGCGEVGEVLCCSSLGVDVVEDLSNSRSC